MHLEGSFVIKRRVISRWFPDFLKGPFSSSQVECATPRMSGTLATVHNKWSIHDQRGAFINKLRVWANLTVWKKKRGKLIKDANRVANQYSFKRVSVRGTFYKRKGFAFATFCIFWLPGFELCKICVRKGAIGDLISDKPPVLCEIFTQWASMGMWVR